MARSILPAVAFLVFGWATAVVVGVASAEEAISFNRDIRPILSDKCFQCHGPDVKEIKGGLRLDERALALQGGDSGPTAIVPGSPEKSEIFVRIRSEDRDELMPPPKTHKTISDAELALLRRWVREGANYQGHWSFTTPSRVATAPGVHPIDALVRKKLAEIGLPPSPEADRETLIRRVTLDLTGVGPTPEEVEAFLKDARPDAYEKLVGRLLASPRYGEHMAARWLDLARYADSNGFQTDSSRQMWPWRDWVIAAFNANMPFDQFTVEQLAGDLLPNPRRDQLVATGFNRNVRLNGEGGRIEAEWFAETVIDRVETTGLTWMGLTLNCCRCHDHKYDPVSQKEFYQLFAYFNSNTENGVLDNERGNRGGGNSKPILMLPTPEQEVKLALLKGGLSADERALAAEEPNLAKYQQAWEKEMRARMASSSSIWTPFAGASATADGGSTLTQQADGSWLAAGTSVDSETYQIKARVPTGTLTAFRLEVMPDPSLPEGSLGRAPNGNFVLTGFEAEVAVPGSAVPKKLKLTRAETDFDQNGWAIRGIVPGSNLGADKRSKGLQRGWAIGGNEPENRVPRKAVFAFEPFSVPAGSTVTVRLIHGSPYAKHAIGRFSLSYTGAPNSMLGVGGFSLPGALQGTLLADVSKRTPQQAAQLTKYFRENGEHPLKALKARVDAARKVIEDFEDQFASTMIFKELDKPRDAFLLKRGEYDKPGERVERALPAFLPKLPEGAPNNRLGLARWLVSGEHPLTARVWVNRAWEHFFGIGLSKTTENLGSQAEWPSNLELLDWLATEFVRVKWDMKAMHRLMVTSAAYKQSSKVLPIHLEKDPENRFMARASRFRLPGEVLRDQALSVSGMLVEKLGGPSVRPYMPPAVWDETSVYGDMRNYKADTGEGLYRRSLYTIWKRTAAPPSMLLFDSPSREICTVKRSRTNTPLQALSLMNEITYVEAARRLAERMISEGGSTPESRIAWGFRRVLARQPDSFELQKLASNLASRRSQFAQDAESAAKLISVGASTPSASISPSELAAYTVTANVILNLDETVMRN